MFNYAKTHVPDNNMDKFTEKVPSPSERNFHQPRFMGQDNFSEANKGFINKSIEGGGAGDQKNDPYFNMQKQRADSGNQSKVGSFLSQHLGEVSSNATRVRMARVLKSKVLQKRQNSSITHSNDQSDDIASRSSAHSQNKKSEDPYLVNKKSNKGNYSEAKGTIQSQESEKQHKHIPTSKTPI